MNLKSQCAAKDYTYLAPKLISNFTGAMSEDARAMELHSTDYQVDDGVEKLLAFIRKRLNITDLSMDVEAFERYFTKLARKKGDTPLKYINAEESAYRKLQRVLKDAMEGGHEEYSSDEETSEVKKFQLPKRLRGWLFLDRAAIPLKEYSGILNQTGGMNIDKLKTVMAESFKDKVLRDIDQRNSVKPPWQKSASGKSPSRKEHSLETLRIGHMKRRRIMKKNKSLKLMKKTRSKERKTMTKWHLWMTKDGFMPTKTPSTPWMNVWHGMMRNLPSNFSPSLKLAMPWHVHVLPVASTPWLSRLTPDHSPAMEEAPRARARAKDKAKSLPQNPSHPLLNQPQPKGSHPVCHRVARIQVQVANHLGRLLSVTAVAEKAI